jgi:hypothetical protein
VKYHGCGDPWLPRLAGRAKIDLTGAEEFNSARTPTAEWRWSCGTANIRTYSPGDDVKGPLSPPRWCGLSETDVPLVRLPPVSGRRPWASAPSLRTRLGQAQP